MRIRTDGEYGHRRDTIESAAEQLGCNKTEAILVSCDLVGNLLDNVGDALEHEELPPRVRDEIAQIISTRQVEIEIAEATVEVDVA